MKRRFVGILLNVQLWRENSIHTKSKTKRILRKLQLKYESKVCFTNINFECISVEAVYFMIT